MTATFEQAREDMCAMVKALWDTTGYGMAWPDVAAAGLPPSTQVPWARTSIRHTGGRQRGMAGSVNRYEREGYLTVQVFAPKGDGLSRAYQLAKTIADGLEGKASPRGVWYRDVRIVEVDDPKSNFSQVNVVAEFRYDEVK